MLQFLLAVHFVLTISIIALIMLQKHDSDGALGSSGRGAAGGMFSIRGQANILTKATAVLMSIFFVNCLTMAKLVKHTPDKGSLIDRVVNERNNSIAGTNNPVKENNIPDKTARKESKALPVSGNMSGKDAANKPQPVDRPTPSEKG